MSSIDIDYIGEAGINAVLTLLKAEIDSKSDMPGAGNLASPSAAGFMSEEDKIKLNGMTSVLNAEILFDSASGTVVTNGSTPYIDFDSGKSLSSYADGYVEIFFRQNTSVNGNSTPTGGLNSVKALIHSVSGATTIEPAQLISWAYDSANTALSFTACIASVSNGTRLTFSNPESAAFSLTIYRVVGYK